MLSTQHKDKDEEMSAIEVVDHRVVYDNPIPHLKSRHGYFPGLAKTPSGDLVGLFLLGEAFDAADRETYVTRSSDQGKTWELQGPLYAGEEIKGGFKPTALSDGTLIALGYGFRRDDPEVEANPETGGLPEGKNLVSFSRDEGRTWTRPSALDLSRPEVIEVSGPCIELESGDLFATGATMKMWDGTTPSGNVGVVLTSPDKGRTWNDDTLFMRSENVCAYETRSCEMQDGRIVVMVWMFDEKAGDSLTNHVVVSHDSGHTWSDPIDTGIPAQASNLMYLGGDRLLTVHCHRGQEPIGLFVRTVDFANDSWNVLAEACAWNRSAVQKITSLLSMSTALRFGQPSLLALDNGDVLATHWSIEEGQGRILTHRLRVNPDAV